MELVNLIISLISGAAGGNIAGALMKDKGLGVVGNSIAGILGGGIGGTLLEYAGIISKAAVTPGGLDIGNIVANIGSSGVGGAILLVVVSLLKNAFMKK